MPQPPRNGGLNDLRPSERMFSDGLFVDSNGNSCMAAVLPFAVWILSAREWRHRYVSSECTAFDWTSRFPLPDEMRLQIGSAAVRHGFAAMCSFSLPCRRPFPDRSVPWWCSWLRTERGRRVPVPSVRARLLRGSRCRGSRFPDVCAAALGCPRR